MPSGTMKVWVITLVGALYSRARWSSRICLLERRISCSSRLEDQEGILTRRDIVEGSCGGCIASTVAF